MKVTIALITYNRPNYLFKAINGILNQTFTDFEFLILDNGSTSETKEVISQFKDKRIKYIRSEQNQRSFVNIAFREALGEYLLITHDDDIMLPDLLIKQVDIMDHYSDSIVVSCNACYIDENDKITNNNILHLKYLKIFKKHQYINHFLQGKNGIICPTALLRKEYFVNQKLYFELSVGPAADNFLWIKSNLSNKSLLILPDVLYKYRVHSNQDSNNHELEINEQLNEAVAILLKEENLAKNFPLLQIRRMINYAKLLNDKSITKNDYKSKIRQLEIADYNIIIKYYLIINKIFAFYLPYQMLLILRIQYFLIRIFL